MKKIYLILFSILTFISCEEDDSSIIRPLSDFERTIIPFEEEETVEFANELLEIITANVTAKDFGTSYAHRTRDGQVFELEYVTNIFTFESSEEEFMVQISRAYSADYTEFSISLNTMDDTIGVIGIQGCEYIGSQDLELELMDTTVNGFGYTNVYKFEPCDHDEINLVIVQIIYSIENGIEFIEYEDGTYLRQITE